MEVRERGTVGLSCVSSIEGHLAVGSRDAYQEFYIASCLLQLVSWSKDRGHLRFYTRVPERKVLS